MSIQSKVEPLKVKRRTLTIESKKSRVITRPYMQGPANRIKNIMKRVMDLSEKDVNALLDQVLHEFADRHRNFRDAIKNNYYKIERYLLSKDSLSENRQMLLGSYFTAEYSIESAALFNPSIVLNPDQDGIEKGKTRFIISLRATGEGHISSIEFRSGIIDENNNIFFDPISDFVETAEIHLNPTYNKHLFQLKLNEMGACNKTTTCLLERLQSDFTFNELKEKISEIKNQPVFPEQMQNETIDIVLWLAKSNYEINFKHEHSISERVIFPVSENESRGIEDARFVRFVDDNGDVTYYATYTAFNGFRILPQMIETKDFLTFKIITLNGNAIQNKGMALFPRKINGNYVMLSRQDGENNYIMFSDDIHFWQEYYVIQEPSLPWEFIQMGNCGSPIETSKGWIMLTHGVGPMKKYCISAELLDLDNPLKVIGKLDEPILIPIRDEREGYVPNVVYSCGSIILNDELIIPYGMADSRSGIATLPVTELLQRLCK